MPLLYGYDRAIAKWVADLIPYVGDSGFGPCAAIGVTNDDQRLIAGVVYHDYQPDYSTIQLSMAAVSPMWARKENIKSLLAYPFCQLETFKCWTSVRADNKQCLRMMPHLGFDKEATLAHHYGPKQHAIIWRMTEPQFRRRYGDTDGTQFQRLSAA